MSNVMSLKSFQNNVKRNGFDLSYKNAFTAKAGELLPVSVIECIPGDKFRISSKSFTRTQPLNSAAFVRMREYYDVFFVPYRLLWNRYPTFFTNMKDFHHAAGINQSGDVTDMHPWFTFDDIKQYLGAVAAQDTQPHATNFFGFDRATLTKKLLDLLGYGSDWTDDARTENTVFNPNPLLAYQKIYQDFFRDDQWENAAPYSYNLDYITQASGGTNLHIPVTSIDVNLMNMFDMRYCNFPKDYFMGMLPSAQYGAESFVPLGGGVSGDVQFDLFPTTNGLSNPAMIHYALNQNSGSEAVGSGLINQSTWYTGSPQTFSNHSIKYQGSSSVVKDTDSIADTENGIILDDRALWNALVSRGISAHTGGSSVSSGLAILALRQAEALQKWKEISQSGRQDYRTQMQKHFNVTPSEAMADHCHYVGGWTANVDINEVVNTNLSTVDDQPDIRGKGVSIGNGGVSFDCKEHGLLMVIYHNYPLLDYVCNGYHRLNVKTNFTDYAIPEFDSVGMQQVLLGEFGYLLNSEDPTSDISLGYVPRYAEYKTRYDEVHGAFSSSLQNWVAPLTKMWFSAYQNAVVERYGSFKIVSEFFKVNPSILDNLFGVNATASVDTDQFLVNCFMDIKAVRNLDYNGLPY